MRWLALSTCGLLVLGAVLVLRFGVGRGRPLDILARLLAFAAKPRAVARATSAAHTRVYCRSRGRLLRWWFGERVLVIETIGRRTGQRRRTTIAYLLEDGDIVVTPANAGADRTPGWWLNLLAAGAGRVLVDGAWREVRPRVVTGAERARLWAAMLQSGSAVGDYQRFTQREFPVAVLEPAVVARDERGAPVDLAGRLVGER